MKIQKRIEITKRGYALLNKYVPGLVMAKAIAVVLETLSPFVTVWFSARIINELENKGYSMEYVGVLRFDRYRLKMYKLIINNNE